MSLIWIMPKIIPHNIYILYYILYIYSSHYVLYLDVTDLGLGVPQTSGTQFQLFRVGPRQLARASRKWVDLKIPTFLLSKNMYCIYFFNTFNVRDQYLL